MPGHHYFLLMIMSINDLHDVGFWSQMDLAALCTAKAWQSAVCKIAGLQERQRPWMHFSTYLLKARHWVMTCRYGLMFVNALCSGIFIEEWRGCSCPRTCASHIIQLSVPYSEKGEFSCRCLQR